MLRQPPKEKEKIEPETTGAETEGDNASREEPVSWRTFIMPRSTPLERKIVLTRFAQVSAGMAIGFPTLYFLSLYPMPPLPRLIDRLVFTLRLQAFSISPLILAISNVSMTRLVTPAIDPINGRAEHLVAFPVRFLQNTLEQYVVHLVGVLTLSCYLNESQMRAVPIIVLAYVAGRVAFYIGYKSSYLRRTIGWSLCFVPSSVMWLVNLGFFIDNLVHPNSALT